MAAHQCRSCRGQDGHIVLDLGNQPACDYFPAYGDSGPDPVYPLQMWLCSRCGLAQLLDDPTVPEEPKGAEPAALVAQAADAIARVSAAGLLPAGARVAEYGSPHGGSWLDMLASRGLKPVHDGGQADVILDCFGLMHAADQAAALAERASRLAPGGVLLLQFHSIETILRAGQWNALRHGHFAYYSTTALTAMLRSLGEATPRAPRGAPDGKAVAAGAQAVAQTVGLSPRTAWLFDLYGGTVLLAAQRDGEGREADDTVTDLLAGEERAGVARLAPYERLQRDVRTRADALHAWLTQMRESGKSVLGYGAASRAVALLRTARVDADLLPAIADASPGKRGLRMPGTSIPVITPAELAARTPDAVALFVSDLMTEVRSAYPEIERAGGQWVDADAL